MWVRQKESVQRYLVYVSNFKETRGANFNLPGYSHGDLQGHVVERMTPNKKIRLERESYWLSSLHRY